MLTIDEVAVFRTNVMDPRQAALLITKLQVYFPGSRISFDLEDCDKVLRIEGAGIDQQEVLRLLREAGYYCDMLL